MSRQSWTAYVKAAVKNRWNLLLLGGGAALAVISGKPDIVLPLIAAVEVAYLATVAWNPRYRGIVDAEATHQNASVEKHKAQDRLVDLLGSLSRERSVRFNELRTRCAGLRDAVAAGDATLTAVAKEQLASVDKLLWVFVKLLHTEQTLERFLGGVSDRELEQDIQSTKKHLDMLVAPGTDAVEDRKRATLDDTLLTLLQRRANIGRAQQNYELVDLEINRIEQKLQTIVEMAINRQDPAMLTAEVGAVADSVKATEDTIGELQIFSGLTQADLEVPHILVEEEVATRRR